MGQDHFREVDALTLAAKLEQRQQTAVEDGALLYGGVAVVEDLGKERVEPDERTHVRLKEDQGVDFVLGGLDGFVVLRLPSDLEDLLGGFVFLDEAVPHRFERLDQLALLGAGLEFHRDHAVNFEVVVMAGGVELGAKVDRKSTRLNSSHANIS